MLRDRKPNPAHELLFKHLADLGIINIVSTAGLVWRVGVMRRGGRVEPVDPSLLARPSRNGYMRLRVNFEGVTYRASEHRIIYRAAHGWHIPDGHVVDHINRRRNDNRAANLRAISQSRNTLDGGRWPALDSAPCSH